MPKLVAITTVVTVLIARATLWTTEAVNFNHYVYAGGFRWHHLYTGILVMLAAWLIPKRFRIRNLGLGIGLGLAIDEITLPIDLLGIASISYWSPIALVSVAVALIVVVFVSAKKL